MQNSKLESDTTLAAVATSRRQFINFAAAGTVAVAAIGLPAFAAPPKSKISTPTLSVFAASQVSIDLQVCAGATGAPAGFSIQWMTQAEYIANGNQWYLSEDPRLCKASFSGNANISRYNLAAGECVVVNIGDFLFDNGASTNCAHALICGVSYVFRAFAHATSTQMRSDFTANVIGTTSACTPVIPGCTHEYGYWKTHGPILPNGDANPSNLWPASVQLNGMMLGLIQYDQLQLLTILTTAPVGGNRLVTLAHQLISAKLNEANGADVSAIAPAIAAADILIGGLIIPPFGSGSLTNAQASGYTQALKLHNDGGNPLGNCTN